MYVKRSPRHACEDADEVLGLRTCLNCEQWRLLQLPSRTFSISIVQFGYARAYSFLPSCPEHNHSHLTNTPTRSVPCASASLQSFLPHVPSICKLFCGPPPTRNIDSTLFFSSYFAQWIDWSPPSPEWHLRYSSSPSSRWRPHRSQRRPRPTSSPNAASLYPLQVAASWILYGRTSALIANMAGKLSLSVRRPSKQQQTVPPSLFPPRVPSSPAPARTGEQI